MAHFEHKLSCMAGRMAVIVMMAVLVCAISITVAWAAETTSCLSATGEAAVAPCRRELLRDPGNVEIRFALSDAFMSIRRYEDAVSVLREGLERFPGDDGIKKKLTFAESYLEEQRWIEKQQKSVAGASRPKKQDTKIRLNIIRCKKLKGDGAMAACNEGLRVNPDHPELLTGRGNAWLAMDRFGNAILDYEAAIAADPKNRDAHKNLRLARTKRNVKVTQCLQTDGLSGLNACDAALLKGASDEFSIQKRRARLLHTMGREKASIAAYRAAARLNPADVQIRQALAALAPRSKKPATRQVQKPDPIATKPTASSTFTPPPPAKKKPPIKPIAPKTPPIEVAAVKPVAPEKPPVMAAAAKPSAPETPPEKAAAVEPIAPAAPPVKVVAAKAAKPEAAVKSATAKALDPPEVKAPPVQAPALLPEPLKIATSQSRQYSNAPAVPGITH